MAKSLGRSTLAVSGFTMLSRILGFVRDMIFASIFGAGMGFDAFVMAFRIPNFFRRLFGEGAFNQAFVPVLANYQHNDSPESLKQFVDRMAGTLGLALMIVVALGEMLAPWIVRLFAPGFHFGTQRFALAQHMLHITFPYLLLIALVAFAGAILNTFNKFSIPAVTPVLLNLCLISAAWLLAPHFTHPIIALAWGVAIAGVMQLALQIPALKKQAVLPRPRLGWRDPGVRRVLTLMIPALFGVSIQQISLLVDNMFASFLPVGSISWLYYSDRLTYLPLGVIGVALATVVLPKLSRAHASKSVEEYSKSLVWAVARVWFLGLPAALGLIVLAGPILATLFFHGDFNRYDVVMSAKSLRMYALGLPAFMFIKVLASSFYAKQNIKLPVKVAGIALCVNIIFNFALIHPLLHAGLALSSSIAATVNALLLWILLHRKKMFDVSFKSRKTFVVVVMASVLMVAAIYFTTAPLASWLSWGVWTRLWHLAVELMVGCVVYFGVVWLLQKT